MICVNFGHLLDFSAIAMTDDADEEQKE